MRSWWIWDLLNYIVPCKNLVLRGLQISKIRTQLTRVTIETFLRHHISFVMLRLWSKFYINIIFGSDPMHEHGRTYLEGIEPKLPEKFCFIKICSRFGRRLTFCYLLLPTSWYPSEVKKSLLWFWKQSHFCVKRLVLIGEQLMNEYISNVNGLIKTV